MLSLDFFKICGKEIEQRCREGSFHHWSHCVRRWETIPWHSSSGPVPRKNGTGSLGAGLPLMKCHTLSYGIGQAATHRGQFRVPAVRHTGLSPVLRPEDWRQWYTST